MRAAIQSIQAKLAAGDAHGGITSYFIDVPPEADIAYPYVLLWVGSGDPDYVTLSGIQDLRDSLGVTMVATLPESCLDYSRRVRGLLKGFRPESDTWLVNELKVFDSQTIQPDRDVTLPGTNRNPYFCVDLYRFSGQPH